MATITRRTVFYEKGSGGEFRWHDWAMVNTSLGMMLEPRPSINPVMHGSNSGADRDYTDDCARVDDIAPASLDRTFMLMSDTAITGGNLVSRVGR